MLHAPSPARRCTRSLPGTANSDSSLSQRRSEQCLSKVAGIDSGDNLNDWGRVALDAAGDMEHGVAWIIARIDGAAAADRGHASDARSTFEQYVWLPAVFADGGDIYLHWNRQQRLRNRRVLQKEKITHCWANLLQGIVAHELPLCGRALRSRIKFNQSMRNRSSASEPASQKERSTAKMSFHSLPARLELLHNPAGKQRQSWHGAAAAEQLTAQRSP